jgi:hypothetical protein
MIRTKYCHHMNGALPICQVCHSSANREEPPRPSRNWHHQRDNIDD